MLNSFRKPRLPIEFVRDILIAKNMNGHEPFSFEE